MLTGTDQQGVVIFGNDYLLTFNADNHIRSKRQLHRNLIPVSYGGTTKKEATVDGTVHHHLPETGDFISATDICTLMLYEKIAGWRSHQVVSKKYLNIRNCKTDALTVIPTPAKAD